MRIVSGLIFSDSTGFQGGPDDMKAGIPGYATVEKHIIEILSSLATRKISLFY